MADRLKGITIEIDGDTTGLSSALKGVNTEIGKTQSALKDTEKLLKFDPSNTVLLKQKQSELKDAISQTSDKLKSLKDKEADMSASLSAGKITQSQYDSYQREIVSTEQSLKGLKDEQKEFGNVASAAMQDVSDKLGDIGDKCTKVGTSLTKNVTAPIVAVGGASLAAFNEVDTAMDTVATKTGASGDALKSMQDVAEGIATTIPTDFQTAGNAVGEVNTRFKSTGDELSSLSTQFIQFANINNADVSTSVDNASMIMQQFGLSTSDTSGLLGQITSVSQNTGVSVDSLMGTLQNSGSAMRSMGLDASQSITLLGNFSAAGIDSETAMKAMSKAAQNYSKDGKNVAEGMTTLISGIKDGTVSYTELADVVGTKNALAFSDMAKSGRLSLDNLNTSLGDYSSTVSDTFNNTVDPIDQSKVALNNLKSAGASLGASIGSVLGPMLEKVSGYIKDIKAKFDALSPAQQEMIVKIALAAAAIGPLVVAIGGLFKGLQSIASGLSVIMAHPIIAGIALAIAAIVLLWNNCAWFRDMVTNAFNFIKGVVDNIWPAIQQVITDVWNAIKTIWDACQPFFESMFNAINTTVGIVFAVIGAVITGCWNVIKAVWDVVGPFFEALWNGISAVASPIWDAISGFVTGAWDTIKTVWDTVSDFFKGIWDAVAKPVTDIWDGIKTTFSNAIDWIKGLFNFEWHWPSIPLPHFSMTPANWQIIDIFDGSWPKIGIDWYDKGGVFNSPNIIGVGEKRPEFVGALDDLRQIVRDETNTSPSIGNINVTVNPSQGMDEKQLADYTIERLQFMVNKKSSAFGG